MQLSNLDLKQICSAFDNAQTIGINYSWLGAPSYTFTANGQEYSDSLAELETKVENLIRSKQESRTPEAYIQTAYVVDKFCQLKERSEKEIDQVNCVTRIFYRLREALGKFSLKIIPNYADDINLFKNC